MYKVTAVLFQRVLAATKVVRHDSMLVVEPLGNSISLRQVLLVYFVALFVARRRIPLFRQLIVSVATTSLDYEFIRLFEKALRLVTELVVFVARGGRIERFRFVRNLNFLCALPNLALPFVPDRIPSILPLVFQERLDKLILFCQKRVVVG